jgi:hypothetical protein
VNPDGFSAAPALVRKTAEAAKRSPGTALNFVVKDGSADETVLGAVLAAAAELASRLRRSGLRTGEIAAIRGGGGSRGEQGHRGVHTRRARGEQHGAERVIAPPPSSRLAGDERRLRHGRRDSPEQVRRNAATAEAAPLSAELYAEATRVGRGG